MSPDLFWRVIQVVAENKAPGRINLTLLKDKIITRGEILILAENSLGGYTDRNGGTLTAVRYRDDILDLYVRRYADAIGDEIILTEAMLDFIEQDLPVNIWRSSV
ncbi:hypothetical protein AVEN_261120-1 [Araneus ventricosus]|uniref:Uncharacterized protein n=1 Tax=Araneus ventricosus TaxID=182803 RepID=A0A4Y2JGJ0_ARAVE|nr:hypothetical protein AVEN_261120-1 [Araneus ventricosus]